MTPPGRVSRLSVGSWLVYDLANTIFALGVIGLYLPDWLKSVGQPDSSLAIVEAAAGLIVVFLAPWAGARSDARGTRVPTLVTTTLVAVIATAILASWSAPVTLASLGVALIGFNVGSVVYDALLVEVSTVENRGWISGLGVGTGYLGSFVGLGIGVLTLDVFGWSYAATFRMLALGFLIFAIPAFLFIEEAPSPKTTRLPTLRDATAQMVRSWRKAAEYPGVVRFLLGRFLYTDAINTLIGGFLTIFVIEELGLDRSFVTSLLGVAITAAIVGAVITGRVVTRLGPVRVLRWVLIVWMIGIGSGIAAAVTDSTSLAWGIGVVGGLALGGTWAADRVVMTRISPPGRLGEFYGLYATVGRFATIMGPLVWAFVVDGLHLSRNIAMTALMVFVGGGWWIIAKVDDSDRAWGEDEGVISETPDVPLT